MPNAPDYLRHLNYPNYQTETLILNIENNYFVVDIYPGLWYNNNSRQNFETCGLPNTPKLPIFACYLHKINPSGWANTYKLYNII